MNSMTGYGRAAAENERFRVEIALRSVNHRSLDLAIRLREPYRSVEAEVRARLADRLGRGRVEVSVDVVSLQLPAPRVRLDLPLVSRVLSELEGLAQVGAELGRLSASDILAIPEALVVERPDPERGGGGEELLLECLDRAVDELVQSRAQEGRSLFASLESTLKELAVGVGDLSAQRESARAALAERFVGRLYELLEAPLPGGSGQQSPSASTFEPARLEQELALLVEKSDIAEELDRLGGHLEHFKEALGSSEPVGKRLDFMTQEIARELNTSAAKCRDLDMTRRVIDCKVFCERLREQTQNVE